MRNTIVIILSCLFIHCDAQIVLPPGYKCRFEEDQLPNLTAEMYRRNDTFLFTFYRRDIEGELDAKEFKNITERVRRKELKTGLELCFDGPYIKTRDSLYIATGVNLQNVYFYKIYVPEQMISISVRSNKNDNDFSEKSKWLLSQIRLHRKEEIYLVNDKKQTCQDPGMQDE
jgi:hypothetical protein